MGKRRGPPTTSYKHSSDGRSAAAGGSGKVKESSARQRDPKAACSRVRPTDAKALGKGAFVIRALTASMRHLTARSLSIAPVAAASRASSSRRRTSPLRPAKTWVSKGWRMCVMPAGMKWGINP